MIAKDSKNYRKILFVVFVAILFLKEVTFHYLAFHSIVISSFRENPAYFFLFYEPKLALSLVLGSLIYIFRKNWWTIPVMFFSDIWCISNLIYYKIFDTFLTMDSISLVGNMKGGWSSVVAYINYQDILFIAPTLLWTWFIIKNEGHHQSQHRSIIPLLSCVLAAALLNNWATYSAKKMYLTEIQFDFEKHKGRDNMLDTIVRNAFPVLDFMYEARFLEEKYDWITSYISQKSILSYFPAAIGYKILFASNSKQIFLSQAEANEIIFSTGLDHRNPIDNSDHISKNRIVIILVESLESWVFEKDIEGQSVMPNLMRLINDTHTLYCHKIKSQVINGNSGDGQMIINTGLLPLSRGVACMEYSDNRYPNLAHSVETSTIINPWPGIWNQDKMTERYSYKLMVQPGKDTIWNDEQVFEQAALAWEKGGAPSILFVLTISSHVPFDCVGKKELNFSKSTPKILDAYLNSLHYTDKQMWNFIRRIQDDGNQNISVVITGDHTIFKTSMIDEFSDFSARQGLSIAASQSYCPLIIYSPAFISDNIRVIDEECYQMDIFTTVQHLIGDEMYPWHGFGVNLMDTNAVKNRHISEKRAFELSDTIIRSDFFGKWFGL